VSRLNHVVGVTLVILAALVIFALLPLGTALEIGGDEGYELMKGFLCSKGFAMYKDIWCDQPPLFPNLLGCAFHVFGPSLLAARLVAAGFGLLLLVVFYQLVRPSTGAWATVAAVFFLLASPGVLFFSVSVMVEVPTIGTALVSAWLVFQWTRRRHWLWLLAGGLVMGLALEIKLTAVTVLPAILVLIVVAGWNPGRNGAAGRQGVAPRPSPSGAAAQVRACTKALLQFGLAAGVVFLAIGLIWGRGSLQSSWKSHTVAQPIPGLSSPEDFQFEPSLLLHHPECLLGAAIALILLGRQGRWRELVFPGVMLVTALAVHSLHRPWWFYYYLHLAVPLAWLSGLAFGEVLKNASQLFSVNKARLSPSSWWKGLGACALAALALAVSEARLEASIKSIRQSPWAKDSPVLAKIKQYAPHSHWVYAQPVIYPFHASLPVPPEIAVVMLKRYWSGQITPKEIVDVCRRYKPEQLLLYRARIGSEWKEFLNAEYRPAYEDTNCILYVSKQILEADGFSALPSTRCSRWPTAGTITAGPP
jgi:4-amino-4-deoxy-L-arabinose transferase-like glycosyltransferase